MANNLNFGGTGSIRLNGVDAINRKLSKVGAEIEIRLSKAAMKKALKPIVDRAKALAPVGKGPLGGMLQDNIGSKITSKKGIVRGVAGVLHRKVQVGTRKKGKEKGKPVFKDPARYAHLVEFGTAHSAPKEFLRPAWGQEGAEKALDVYTKELNTGLDRAIKKL